MGKLQAFEIFFDENNEVFKPGDRIQGRVRIVISEPKGYIRGIKVTCKGVSHTHWTKSDADEDEKKDYTWKIRIFKEQALLWGSGASTQMPVRLELPTGEHYFAFQFTIPAQSMPPSLEGSDGSVRYYIKATIDRPWKFNHKARRFFTIWTIQDLNSVPNIFHLPSSIVQKTVCCLCCESGLFSLRMALDKRGYAPGESILITIEISNQTSTGVESLNVVLFQCSEFKAIHTVSKTHKESKRIAELIFNGCNGHHLVTFDQRPMVVPPVPASMNAFEDCPNIDVKYLLKLKVKLMNSPIKLVVEQPIIIGTIPALPHTQQLVSQTGYPGPQHGSQPPSCPPAQGAPQPGYPPPLHGQQLTGPVPPSGQFPSGQQGYPPQAGYPQQSGYPQPGYPPLATGGCSQSHPPLVPAPFIPPHTFEMSMEGPRFIPGKLGYFGLTKFVPRYPYYGAEALAPSPELAAGTSNRAQAPIVVQPTAGHEQQPSNNPFLHEQQQPLLPPAQPEEIKLKEYPADKMLTNANVDE